MYFHVLDFHFYLNKSLFKKYNPGLNSLYNQSQLTIYNSNQGHDFGEYCCCENHDK